MQIEGDLLRERTEILKFYDFPLESNNTTNVYEYESLNDFMLSGVERERSYSVNSLIGRM